MTDENISTDLEVTLKNAATDRRLRTPNALSTTFIHALRFGLVGISATVVHLSIALSLNVALGISALASNTVAFFCAVPVSYFGNLKWVFGEQEHDKFRAGKFLITACSGFIINSVILVTLVSQNLLPDALAIIVSVFFVPLATFIAFKCWVFSR